MKPILDISYYQKPDLINYDILCQNISGVIIRAAYGSGVPNKWYGPDIEWDRHYFEFQKRDKPIGAYHYITEYQPVEEQVEVMRVAIEGKKLSIGRWCDVELENNAEVLTKQTVHKYLQLADAQMGIFDIYTSANYWNRIMGGAYYTNRKLWCAAYTGTEELEQKYIPIGWQSYWLWQNHGTKTGRIPGYEKGVDLSKFCCDEETFNNWVVGISLPKPKPKPKLKLWSPVMRKVWISQTFGVNPQWYSAARGHNGIDYGIVVGTPIYAAMDGIVEVSEERVGGYGRHIRIRHERGITIYGHLSQRLVQVGDTVQGKQLIGYSGGALSDPFCGYSSGPHLHFEFRQNDPVVPLAPGNYTYNAIDTLPFTVDWEKEKGKMLFEVEIITVGGLNVRKGIGTSYDVLRSEPKGTILKVYEVVNGWYRIGENQWVSGDPSYTKKLSSPEPVDNRLEKLWEAHPELH